MTKFYPRIIDNKKIVLTPSEFQLYEEICKSYDRPNFKGSNLFKGLFETDENGIIIFLRPPQDKVPFSMECYLFLVSVMVHQHLGTSAEYLDATIKEAKDVIAEARSLINELKALK